MKKMMNVAFLLLLTITAIQAQVQINPKVGLNVSGLDAKIRDFTTEARTGWNAGIDLRIGEGALFVQPGAHFYSMNTKVTQNPDIEESFRFKDQTSIHLAKFPVNLGYRLTGKQGLLNIYALGGVTPTLLLGVQESADYPLMNDDINDFNLGANLGLGIDLLFLTVDVRYEHGLKDFFVDSSGKNNMLTANVGIRF